MFPQHRHSAHSACPHKKLTDHQHGYLCTLYLVILEKGPKLLQTIQVTIIMVFERLLLEILEEVLPESLLQPVAVEPEETLQSIPVAFAGIFQSKTFELVVHLSLSQRKGNKMGMSIVV